VNGLVGGVSVRPLCAFGEVVQGTALAPVLGERAGLNVLLSVSHFLPPFNFS
jgi:hypothetical protein